MLYSVMKSCLSSATCVGPGDGDLVEALVAVDREHVAAAQHLEHARLDADQVLVEDAHHLVGRARGVRERSQDVEDGAHAELLAHRRGVLHGRMVVGART
jgi:hypothetical protein